MYLYFNKQGNLTAAIPHGEPVRQGSDLNLYFCFDEDFFTEDDKKEGKYNLNVALILPGAKNQGTTTVIPVDFGRKNLKLFRKITNSEMTYDLEDGEYYWTYYCKFSAETSTIYNGKLTIISSLIKLGEQIEGTDTETVEDDVWEKIDTKYLGNADVYIEKTFGNSKVVYNESEKHYKNLISQLNNITAWTKENFVYRYENMIELPYSVNDLNVPKPLPNGLTYDNFNERTLILFAIEDQTFIARCFSFDSTQKIYVMHTTTEGVYMNVFICIANDNTYTFNAEVSELGSSGTGTGLKTIELAFTGITDENVSYPKGVTFEDFDENTVVKVLFENELWVCGFVFLKYEGDNPAYIYTANNNSDFFTVICSANGYIIEISNFKAEDEINIIELPTIDGTFLKIVKTEKMSFPDGITYDSFNEKTPIKVLDKELNIYLLFNPLSFNDTRKAYVADLIFFDFVMKIAVVIVDDGYYFENALAFQSPKEFVENISLVNDTNQSILYVDKHITTNETEINHENQRLSFYSPKVKLDGILHNIISSESNPPLINIDSVIDTKLGNINAILDAINGEEI